MPRGWTRAVPMAATAHKQLVLNHEHTSCERMSTMLNLSLRCIDLPRTIRWLLSLAHQVNIGVGAFFLPLAVHAKNSGKIGMHLGGRLQIFIGIIGKRWRENSDFSGFANEHWCSPRPEETPPHFTINDGGCCW